MPRGRYLNLTAEISFLGITVGGQVSLSTAMPFGIDYARLYGSGEIPELCGACPTLKVGEASLPVRVAFHGLPRPSTDRLLPAISRAFHALLCASTLTIHLPHLSHPPPPSLTFHTHPPPTFHPPGRL